jgi:hypothetical protein
MKSPIERAELGIDGNCGFARLGPNLQEGEAEFEEIRATALNPDPASDGAKKQAISRAYERLRSRIGRPISYFLGESHPNYDGPRHGSN